MNIAGQEVKLHVERKKVRHVYLRLGLDYTLRVTMPQSSRVPLEDIVEDKRPWLERKIQEISRMRRVVTQDAVLLLGRPVPIRTFAAREPRVRLCRSNIDVYGSNDTERDRALAGFLTAQTARLVEKMVSQLSHAIGVEHGGISVKEMKRWGYCTRKGELYFNPKLACLPREVVECVVLHELTHLKHFNHSKEFRDELSKHVPNRRELENRLKSYYA